MKAKGQKPKAPKAAPAANFNWHYLVLFAVPFLLYAKTLAFDFVYHDDDTMIINGANMLEQFGVKDFLTTDAWLRHGAIELYRPWQSITYAIDYALAGTNPWIYHLHNLLVFCLGILLLYRFLQLLNFTANWSFYLSLLYACHFLMAHAASWIPARGDLYLVLFGLLSILAFFKWQQVTRWYWLALSVVAFFFALLAKETGTMLLPVIIAVMFYGKYRPKSFSAWWWVTPFVFFIGVYLLLRQGAVYHSQAVGVAAILHNLPTLPEEVFKFFTPLYFSVMPAFNTVPTMAGSIIMVLIAAAVFVQRQTINRQQVAIGTAIFLITMLPAVFYNPRFEMVTYDYLDHRMFISGIGLLIICGALLQPVFNKYGNKVVAGVFTLAALMALYSFIATENYRNYTNYYQNALRTNPSSALAIVNYSQFLINKEKNNTAGFALIDKAITTYPDSLLFRTIKCDYAYTAKDFALLKTTAEGITGRWPQQAKGYAYLGTYFLATNSFDSSIANYTKAITLNPSNADNYFNRAKPYRAQGKMDEAIADLKNAITLNPNFAMAYFERGNIFGNMGYFKEALDDYQQYVTLAPADPSGYFYRGQALCLTGNKSAGCADLQKAKAMGLADADVKIQQLCR